MRVLLVVDLEGVAGVDDVNDLSAASPGFARARRLLTDEVAAAVRGLRGRGVEHVVVSDSHRPGAAGPTVIPEGLRGVEVVWHGDAYAARLFDDVSAVACLGMHAAAGGGGFAAHTVSVHCAWETPEGRPLSETDLVLALAAERGIPALFVTGDDVLEASVRGPVYVRSKAGGQSRPAADVHADIVRAAAAPPVLGATLPPEIVVRLKSRWQADAAERGGAERVGAHAVRVRAASFREAYEGGVAAVEASGAKIGAAMRGIDLMATLADVRRALGRKLPVGKPAPHVDDARAALRWFLEATRGEASFLVADRALVLAMLRGHAPRFFADTGLDGVRAEAFEALRGLPARFPAGLDPAEAMARVDALYLLAEDGAPRPFDAWELRNYVRSVAASGGSVWAWLFGELMAQMGFVRPVVYPPRAVRESRIADLYWLTHLFLLETRYLARPLPRTGFETAIEELCLAAGELVAERRVDLAAEVAVCLQAAGELEVAELTDILALLRAHQHPDGRVADPSTERGAHGAEAMRLRAHATGAALLAFAGTVG